LIWGFSALTLNAMNGFRVGRNKEECIAAEIAASKAVQEHGKQIAQVTELAFGYIQHKEWNTDGSHKLA
jgi:hypothetical protein